MKRDLFTKLYYLPFYIEMQIFVRIPSESSDRWNKWQPTKRQSLSEFIDYELKYSPGPTNAITSRMWIIGILVIILSILVSSCSEEIGPCYPMEEHCRNLLKKMETATDPKEKEQIWQFYLSEKHLLENCYRENGK